MASSVCLLRIVKYAMDASWFREGAIEFHRLDIPTRDEQLIFAYV
jgi:hypothetical protein